MGREAPNGSRVVESPHTFDLQPALATPRGQRLRGRRARARAAAQSQVPAHHARALLSKPGPRLVHERRAAVEHRDVDARV